MATNPFDGQFALEMWMDPLSEEDPDHNEFSDDQHELRSEAARLIKGGKYKYIVLCRWNPGTDDWDDLEIFEPEE